LTDAVRKLRVGDALAGEVDQGPLISEAAVRKVERYLADALLRGGHIASGGERHALGGTFFEPTVLVNAWTDMLLAQNEIFGPVAPLFRFESEADAIRLANDTDAGLAAYLYTRDVSRAWRVAEALEAGMVGLNTGLISTEVAPFGGVKSSGIGREGSRYGIDDYVELKYLCVAV
jgi:succinate-semialdehyde dehydrogenase/glutarate-semialdehyde dehydrogenase